MLHTVEQLESEIRRLQTRGDWPTIQQLACDLITRGRFPALHGWLYRQWASATYQDDHLPASYRFDHAISLLHHAGLTASGPSDSTTHHLAATIYLQRYLLDSKLDHLFAAYRHARAAWDNTPEDDRGIGACMAAAILDKLAARLDDADRAHYADEARLLRQQVRTALQMQLTALPSLAQNFGFVVSRAEIAFGLHDFASAESILASTKALQPSEESLRQAGERLANLLRDHRHQLPGGHTGLHDPTAPWFKALAALIGDNTATILGDTRGKVGLALSGGGLRATFFHIGVLARLAEMDVLRHIEIVSTVSGGSIAGAHYYLLLRQLLESKTDEAITTADYIGLIKTLQHDLGKLANANIRSRSLANWLTNTRMLFNWPIAGQRIHIMANLLDKLLFAKVDDTASSEPQTKRNIPPRSPYKMRDLLIHPQTAHGKDSSFIPRLGNWRRRNKIPAILINATSLNTGHAWHFDAKGMGEPPALINDLIDSKPRYRRPYYEDLPANQAARDIRLGEAVAASSCVPMLFGPFEIKDLYPDRVIRLVDGGINDNQGVEGLLASGCRFILCSDASGQTCEKSTPGAWGWQALGRSHHFLMEKIRQHTVSNVMQASRCQTVNGFFLAHLKKGLDAHPLSWDKASKTASTGTTPYGIDQSLQTLLADLRTDLDSFTECETHALMLSGYLMTEHAFRHELKATAQDSGFLPLAPRGDWRFLELEPALCPQHDKHVPQAAEALAHQLRIGAGRFFKPWRLAAGQAATHFIVAALASSAIVLLLKQSGVLGTITVNVHTLSSPQWLALILASVALSIIASIGLFTFSVNFHLLFTDPVYLEAGKVKRLFRVRRKPSQPGPRSASPNTAAKTRGSRN